MYVIRRRQMLAGMAASGMLVAMRAIPVLADDELREHARRRARQAINAFVTVLAGHGHAAVAAGQLAPERAASDAVRAYAQQVVQERAPMTEALYQRADASNVDAPRALLADDAAAIEMLRGLSGGAFDAAFVEFMVLRLRSDGRATERVTSTAKTEGWHTYANDLKPVLTGELRQGEALAAALGVVV